MKVGIIGMGKMGLTHAAMLQTLSPGCLVGVVEAERGSHGTIKSLGLNAPVYADLESLLAAGPLDAAIVCTPTFTHYGVVKTLLERGIAVLVEKPLAENLEVCRKLAALAAEKKAVVAVGYSIDYDPLFNEAKRLLKSGAIGKIKGYTAWVEHGEVFGPKKGWLFQKAKSGGGVIINPAPHMLRFLLETFGPATPASAVLKSPYSAVEDEARVELTHGAVKGLLRASWSVPNKPVLELAVYAEGEDGSLAVGGDEILLESKGSVSAIRRADLDGAGDFELSPPARASNYFREDRAFLEDARMKREPGNSIRATLSVDELIDAIYRAGGAA